MTSPKFSTLDAIITHVQGSIPTGHVSTWKETSNNGKVEFVFSHTNLLLDSDDPTDIVIHTDGRPITSVPDGWEISDDGLAAIFTLPSIVSKLDSNSIHDSDSDSMVAKTINFRL